MDDGLDAGKELLIKGVDLAHEVGAGGEIGGLVAEVERLLQPVLFGDAEGMIPGNNEASEDLGESLGVEGGVEAGRPCLDDPAVGKNCGGGVGE